MLPRKRYVVRVNGVSTVWGRSLASVLTASSERTTVVLLKVSQLVNAVFSLLLKSSISIFLVRLYSRT